MDWGIIGHEWAVNLLSAHVSLGQERHAYLLTGPSGIGRRTLALRFVQSLNCPKPLHPGQACRTCSTCKRIEEMHHPDLVIVEAEHEGEIIKIEQVRDLQHTLSLSPYEARYRVALIRRFEEAHSSAANAMLKTLEEPPEHVLVILTANNAENLLPTIVSRCEVLRLRALKMDETAEGLQTLKGISKDIAEKLAHISDGRPGYAIRLFEEPNLLERRQSWLEELFQLLASSRRERFAFAKGVVDDKEGLREELLVWLTFWRDVLIYNTGISESITNLDYAVQIQKLVEVIDLEKTQFYLNTVEQTIELIDHNVNARLALEVLLVDLPNLNIVV